MSKHQERNREGWPWYYVCWYSSGKWWKRQLHKAERAWARGYGRERNVRHWASTVNYKNG